jgi:hypothetical protein
MARFVGGTGDRAGHSPELGLWELEEKRHTPALIALYTKVSGSKPTLSPHTARPFALSNNAREDLYHHGLHRIATEYGATCLYLWLMAHTTGPLQAVLAELTLDEINHMAKFWGFGRWAYPHIDLRHITLSLGRSLIQKWHNPQLQGSLLHTLRRMMLELAWPHWSYTHRLTFLYTLAQVMRVLWQWNSTLTEPYLNALLDEPK